MGPNQLLYPRQTWLFQRFLDGMFTAFGLEVCSVSSTGERTDICFANHEEGGNKTGKLLYLVGQNKLILGCAIRFHNSVMVFKSCG